VERVVHCTFEFREFHSYYDGTQKGKQKRCLNWVHWRITEAAAETSQRPEPGTRFHARRPDAGVFGVWNPPRTGVRVGHPSRRSPIVHPMQRSFCAAARRALRCLIPLALLSACSPEPACDPLPGADLRARVDARLASERAALRESIGHYGLLHDVDQEDLHRFMVQIYPRRDGPDIVMAAPGGIELHGGGVLALIATLWRPNGRPAELSDAFPFVAIQRAVPLREIYDSLQMQVFLPVPGLENEDIDGQLPTYPELPRTLMQHATHGRLESSELDAYDALALLVRYEDDSNATWTNRLGQRLSVATLLDSSWDHYVAPRSAEQEFADHSYLHLVEILLAYNRRLEPKMQRDPNRLKQRLLSVELEREAYGGYEASEAIGHYVESLGFLLAEPGVSWTKPEQAKVCAWIRDLETVRLTQLGEAPVQHLAHLRRGLAKIEANAARMGRGSCGSFWSDGNAFQ